MRASFISTLSAILVGTALLSAACGRDRATDIEVAVALTQTAVVRDQAQDRAAAPAATPAAPADDPAATVASPTEAIDAAPPTLLPAPLFFVDRETQQIVRLDTDGEKRTTLTEEAGVIREFDVRPDGSKLVYVVDNTLIELDIERAQRVVKVDGSEISGESVKDRLERRLHEPHYSPDGQQIAFGLGGVNLIDSGPDGERSLVLPSSPYPDSSGTTTDASGQPIRFFWPKGWSPDGSKLLVEFAYQPEGGGLAIYDLAKNQLIDFSSDDPDITICCDPAWGPDSQRLYVANNLLAFAIPGLSAVDADSGAVASLAHGLPEGAATGSPFRFFRAPFAAEDGLVIFLNQTADLAQQMLSYTLNAVDEEERTFTPLRNDAQPIEGEAVWAADGSGIAYLKDVRIEGERSTGSIVWLPVDGAPVDLPASGQTLRFAAPPATTTAGDDTGAEMFSLPPEEDETSVALSAFVADAWGFTVSESIDNDPGIDGIFSFPLHTASSAAPLWASHTLGLRGFEQEQFHTIGIFAPQGDSWQELARIELGKEVDPNNAEPVPDFLDRGSVSQVDIEPQHIWLSVEGGAGAHSGTFNLLSFDGETLRTEASGFSASPGVAQFADLDGDGNQEVILDASDYYVFCYACGVRLVQYDLLRWNELRMEQVQLKQLPSSVSDELSALNGLALTRVDGGLWKDALAAVEEGRARNEDDPTFLWNSILIELNAEAKREAAESAYGYPILDHVFYGDYEAAVDVMRDYDPSEIFALSSPLIVSTAAQGSTELLADWITRTTSSALTVLPDLPPAHYLRAWAGYLLTGENEVALPEVALAAAVAHEDALYAQSIEYLLDETPRPSPEPTVTATPTVAAQQVNATATPSSTATISGTLTARTLVNVRAGPGAASIGTLAEGERAEVSGRTGDDGELWWQIVFPARSQERGWVSGNPALVDVTAPEAPVIEIEILETAPETETVDAGGTAADLGRLFFSAQNDDGENVIYRLQDEGRAVQVVEMAAQPAIQPGGQRLAFYSSRDDMLGLGGYDLESGQRLRYAYNIEDSRPTWDPDLQRIIFASTRYGDGRSRLYSVWADTRSDAVDIGYGQDPDWHPSEDLLIMKGCDASGSRCGLTTLRPDGSNRRRLTESANDAHPVWTRDGDAVIFMNNDRDGNWELYRLELADETVTRLTDNPANDGLPAISPDGSRIAFMSDRGGVWSIQTMPVDGGPARTLYTIGDNVANWLDQGIAWER